MTYSQAETQMNEEYLWNLQEQKSQTVPVYSPGQCVCVVYVTHRLSSQLLDFWVADSFPSDSAADALVCSDREQKKNHCDV